MPHTVPPDRGDFSMLLRCGTVDKRLSMVSWASRGGAPWKPSSCGRATLQRFLTLFSAPGFPPCAALSFWEHDSQSETRAGHKRVMLHWVRCLHHSSTQFGALASNPVVTVLHAFADPPRTCLACILLSLWFMEPPETVWSAWPRHMFATYTCPVGEKRSCHAQKSVTHQHSPASIALSQLRKQKSLSH
jgi:hypothetical protein